MAAAEGSSRNRSGCRAAKVHATRGLIIAPYATYVRVAPVFASAGARGRHRLHSAWSAVHTDMMRLLLLVLVLLALVNAQLPGKALGKKTGKSSGNGAMSKRPGSSMASAGAKAPNPAAAAVSHRLLSPLPTPLSRACNSAAKRSGAQTQLGKLRSDMMKWYCASGDHSDIPPCQVRPSLPWATLQSAANTGACATDVCVHVEDEGRHFSR